MCRCDLYNAGSELSVYIGVCDNRNHTVHDRQKYALADQMLIPLVIGMDCHRSISQHRLGTGRRKGQELRCARRSVIVHDRILDVPEMTRLLLIFHLCIGDGGVADRTPVDDAGALVDIAFLMHLDKDFRNCLVAAFVHREALSVPVTGGAHLLQLGNDSPAIFLFPCPCSL